MTKKNEAQLSSTISHLALTAGLAVSLSAVVGSAHAQQSGSVSLDTINVQGAATGAGDDDYNVPAASSPKQTAPLLDTPQTVTVVPQAVIRETGSRNLTEVLRNTPGITFDGGENGFGTSTNNFKMRGFDTSGSVFVDGARSSGSYSRDTFNLERVEVFKGPAADNGRGGPGGYINMVTKLPSLRNFTSGDVGIGFDGTGSDAVKRGTADLNYVVAPGTAVRLNALLEKSGVPGRDVAETNAWGIAPSVAFGLGSDFRTFLAYEHVSRRDLPDWGVPAHIVPGTFNFDPSLRNASRRNFYGLRSDFDNTESNSALARFEYDISERMTISNQTRWAHVDRTSRFTVPFNVAAPPTVDTMTMFYDRTNQSITNTTNLSANFDTGFVNHSVATGIEVSHETSDANRFGTLSGAPRQTDIFNPDPDRAGPAPFNPTQTAGIKVDTVAAYFYDTIKFSPQWQLTGGFRVEHYEVGISSKTMAGLPVPGGNDGFSYSHTTFNGKVGLVYKPVEDGSLYVSYGVQHLPPGSYLSNADISRTGDGSAFPGLVPGANPVQSRNYEAGVKWDFFNKRLTATAALFRTEKHYVPFVVGGNIEYGEQIVQGVELGASGDLSPDWKIFGGLLFLNSERRHNAIIDTLAPGSNGDELAFTPRFSGNVWTTYRIPTTNLTLGAGLQYVGESWVGRPDDAARIVKNGAAGKLPSYFLTHLMASYELQKDVHIRFNVDNVFDEQYATALNWSARRAFLGPPRTYRISTSFKF